MHLYRERDLFGLTKGHAFEGGLGFLKDDEHSNVKKTKDRVQRSNLLIFCTTWSA